MVFREYGSFGKCWVVDLGEAEALVTLEFGPRVIRLGFKGGSNLFKEFAGGDSVGDLGFRLYGGHRLWSGPEVPTTCYLPDNEPVAAIEVPDGVRFTSPANAAGIEKSLDLRSIGDRSVTLAHRLTNRSDAPLELFPWALSAMAPGGVCYVPLPEFRAHTEDLLPATPLVAWRYTDFSDPRWRFTPGALSLSQTESHSPQKAGLWVEQGLAAYVLESWVFLKRFEPHRPEDCPDFGCNFEMFTNGEMLEIESVGPIRSLQPGESLDHFETWYVRQTSEFHALRSGSREWLNEAAATCPFRAVEPQPRG